MRRSSVCFLALACACSEATVDIDPGSGRDAGAGPDADVPLGPSLEIEIAYPDDDTRVVAPRVALIPIEPFLPLAGGGRELFGCGDVGPFAPTARINTRSNALTLAHDREVREAADTARWPVALDALGAFQPDNPWGAVLLYFAAEGPAGDRGVTSESVPMVHGCTCVRAHAEATFAADPALDARVKAGCRAIEGPTRIRIPLGPVVGPPFRLEACGATQITAAREQVVEVQPGVCLRVGVCQDASADDCFACSTRACPELEDLSAVPVRVRVQQAGGGTARAIDDVVITEAVGSAQPLLLPDTCQQPITVQASIVGLARPPVELTLSCVPRLALPDRPSAEVALGDGLSAPRLIAISELPTAGSGPSRLVALLDADDATYLDAYEARSTSLVRVARTPLPASMGRQERGLGVVGYHHRIDARGRPVVMVVTHRNGTPVTRVLELVNGIAWTVLLVSDQACARDGCSDAAACGGSSACARPASWAGATVPIEMLVHDQNGDGLSDVTVATDRDFQIRTYVSSPRLPDEPAPLDSCLCTSIGRGLPALEFAHLGGPSPGATSPVGGHTALVAGDMTGAYVLYPTAQGTLGAPCDLRIGPLRCDFPLICREMCAGDVLSARCVEPCRPDDPRACTTSPRRTECLVGAGAADGFCAEPALSCRAPTSVLRLTTVFDLARANLLSRELEDVAALSTDSVFGPSAEVLRIIRGGAYDLTDLSSLGPEAEARAVVELRPRALARDGPPRGGRAVQVGNLNGDDRDDLAVLYTESEEVRVWVGSGDGVPSEAGDAAQAARIRTNTCVGGETCPCEPLGQLVIANLDGSPNEGVIVVCNAGGTPHARWFRW